jgi:hypothetical protein
MVILAVGLLGYALLILAAALVNPVLGLAVAGVICLYIAYANQPARGA